MTIKNYDFIPGIPTANTRVNSEEIRNNFLALNSRTSSLLPSVTMPISQKIKIDSGLIYFADKVSVNFEGALIDLGDPQTGVLPFENSQKGWYRDIFIVLRLSVNENNDFIATPAFIEGPTKIVAEFQYNLVQINNTDIPVAHILIRNNGESNVIGAIEVISRESIVDIRGFLDIGGLSYFTSTIGDRNILRNPDGSVTEDSQGNPQITGSTVGEFNYSIFNENLEEITSLQQAINKASALGGGCIFIKRGLYKVRNAILIPSNISLVGEGANTIIQREDSTLFGDDALFILTGENIFLSNLNIKGNTSNQYAYSELLRLFNCKHCKIDGCIFDINNNSALAIRLDSSSKNSLINNIIKNGKLGIKTSENSNLNIIIGNHFENIIDIPAIEDNGDQNSGTGNSNSVPGSNEDKINTSEIYIDNNFQLNDNSLTEVKSIYFSDNQDLFDTSDRGLIYKRNGNIFYKDDLGFDCKLNILKEDGSFAQNKLIVSDGYLSNSGLEFVSDSGTGLSFNDNKLKISLFNSSALELSYDRIQFNKDLLVGKINSSTIENSGTANLFNLNVTKTYGTALSVASNALINGELIVGDKIRLKEQGSDQGAITIKTPYGVQNYDLTLPSGVGFSNQFLATDGYGSLYWNNFEGNNHTTIFKTPGSHTWIAPKTGTILATVVGSGSGGGSYANSDSAGTPGGSGGGVSIEKRQVVAGNSYDIQVGIGGELDRDGNQSSFEDIVAYGGNRVVPFSIYSGDGGNGSGFGFDGAKGSDGSILGSAFILQSAGGNTLKAAGGTSFLRVSATGTLYGSNGGGGASFGCGGSYNNLPIYGGGGCANQAGADGVVILEYIEERVEV